MCVCESEREREREREREKGRGVRFKHKARECGKIMIEMMRARERGGEQRQMEGKRGG